MLPFIGIMLVALAVGVAAAGLADQENSRNVGLVFSGIVAALAIVLLVYFILVGSISYYESYQYYLPSLNVLLSFTLNPISFVLLFMTSIVAFVTLLSGNPEHESERLSTSLILLFELSAVGLFASSNLFLFFIFWDVGVVALFFMLYMLGSANRRKAAMKFIMYEIMASLLLLFAIMIIYFYTPLHSFDIQYIEANAGQIPANTQTLLFVLLFLAFLTNMPVFPLHLWLPEAHTEASTQGSMLLSGVLTKFGGYGMLLLFLMIPISTEYSNYVAVLAGISAIYIAFVLMTQHDIKRVIAYTTITEMSIILLGIASLNQFGILGATYGMLAHGFTIALMFLAAGTIGHVFGTRDYRFLKGMVSNAVSTAYTFLAGVFATTGVPLTAAFIGDILIFIGAVRAFGLFGAVPLISILLFGVFLYYIVDKSFLSTREQSQAVEPVEASQEAGFAILLFFIFLFGVLPFVVLNFFNV